VLLEQLANSQSEGKLERLEVKLKMTGKPELPKKPERP
jgi:hypothetical protein